MPTYVYRCAECGDFEAVQKFSDDPLTICPQGHSGIKRVITPAGIIFKGSGWYIKDSKANGNTTGSSSSQKSEKSEGGEKSDSKESAPAASSTSTDSTTTTSESKPASPSKTEAA